MPTSNIESINYEVARFQYIGTGNTIDLLTTRGLNFVWFPKQLETIYRFQYQNGAAYEFRYRAPIILILYLFLSFGIYQVLPTEQVLSWLSYYSWVGIIVLIAWIFIIY